MKKQEKDIFEQLNSQVKEQENKSNLKKECSTLLNKQSLEKVRSKIGVQIVKEIKPYTIYRCLNKLNGKSYVGACMRSLSQRIWEHLADAKRNSQGNFHIALRQYGFENWTWETLATCQTKEQLDYLENYYVDMYDSFRNGYNMTQDGRGNREFKTKRNAKKI